MIITKIDGNIVEPSVLREKIAIYEDAELIEKIQKQVQISGLKDNKGQQYVFATDNLDFINSIIKSKRGIIKLYYYGDNLVSFYEMTVPDDSNELKEKYPINQFGIKEADWRNMAVAESFVVLKKFRGNGLQVKMFKDMEKVAKKEGITCIVGTVHPDNWPSCRNFKKAGYKVLDSKEKPFYAHGGPRHLQYKEI